MRNSDSPTTKRARLKHTDRDDDDEKPRHSGSLPPHQGTPPSPHIPAISPLQNNWRRTDYFEVSTTTAFTSLAQSQLSTPLTSAGIIFTDSSRSTSQTSSASVSPKPFVIPTTTQTHSFSPSASNIQLRLPQLPQVRPDPSERLTSLPRQIDTNTPPSTAPRGSSLTHGHNFPLYNPSILPSQRFSSAPYHIFSHGQQSRAPTSVSFPSTPVHWLPPHPVLPMFHPMTQRAPRHSTSPQQQPPAPITFPFNPLSSTLARDALLSYAQRLFTSPSHPVPSGLSPVPVTSSVDPTSPDHRYRSQLLPLLTTLRNLHPQHIPTLLLLSCVLYAIGDYQGSLAVNSEILTHDPNYVEAMSNIGTTLKALGHFDEAESWWYRAIRIRPTYWDAVDNLLGALCSHRSPTGGSQRPPQHRKALELCEFIHSQVIRPNGHVLIIVPLQHVHRLQNLLYTSGNLRLAMDPPNRISSVLDYSRALEVVLRPPRVPRVDDPDARDLLVGVCIAAMLQGGSAIPAALPAALGKPNASTLILTLLRQQMDFLREIHKNVDTLLGLLLDTGQGVLPTVLLFPDQALELRTLVLSPYTGILPGLCSIFSEDSSLNIPARSHTSNVNKMTSTVLLALAKVFQDAPRNSNVQFPGAGSGIIPSTSLVLLCYYAALALHPLPSTYNNLGILLSSVESTSIVAVHGNPQLVTGPQLADAYYRAGLGLDPDHPHLLTNLGSLTKDQGNPQLAIDLYAKAIKHKPDFDVALANIANTLKDAGRTQEAITYFRRAVEVNPTFPEAVCGLANALGAICDWRGRGGLGLSPRVDDDGHLIEATAASPPSGWMGEVDKICTEQLRRGSSWGAGVMQAHSPLDRWLQMIDEAVDGLGVRKRKRWEKYCSRFFEVVDPSANLHEGAFIVRLAEELTKFKQHKWYIETYGPVLQSEQAFPLISENIPDDSLPRYGRPNIPAALGSIIIPSVLPFHTFTYPLSARTIRLISYRTALRISHSGLTRSWLPPHVFPPPPPPLKGKLNIGYVSSDFINHPLGHLTQSVFGFHDREQFNVFVYATSPSDGSQYRTKIESHAHNFLDVSAWSGQAITERIVADRIHILINLGGYTKGARNDIFAARPCPIQIGFMGFAGTLAAGWCDYLVCDRIACPEDSSSRGYEVTHDSSESERLPFGGLDPESSSEWMFTEKFIYMPHTFFVTDHKQSFREDDTFDKSNDPSLVWKEEERRRMKMRREIFPDISDDTVIFANFSQLYKVDPAVFAAWMRILKQVPRSILWLLRFPAAAEEHLLRTAALWGGPEVASRVRFTDVAKKEVHIQRGRVADLFLDTFDCNAHTIAADVLWSGTPILTWPKHRLKMCSRVGASIANATGFGKDMVVESLIEYERRAVDWAKSLSYTITRDEHGAIERKASGPLIELRKKLYLNRETMPLFDTISWTRHLEQGLKEAWTRWVAGKNLGDFKRQETAATGEDAGYIWIKP